MCKLLNPLTWLPRLLRRESWVGNSWLLRYWEESWYCWLIVGRPKLCGGGAKPGDTCELSEKPDGCDVAPNWLELEARWGELIEEE